MRIVINFGHGPLSSGNFDPGAVAPDGYQESTETREVGTKIVAKLKANGWDVLAIQDGDLADITHQSNLFKADYFVSVHADSFTTPDAHGTTTFAYSAGGKGEKIAIEIQNDLIASTGLTDRGVKFANYWVLKYTDCPAVLVEISFISNPAEEALMKQDSWNDKVASAICKGFSRAVGVSYADGAIVPPKPIVEVVVDKDIYLSVRVRQSKSDVVVNQIIAMGYACKVLPLA
jgi:N-acetylmuramoyl-L-alanine amidase